MGPPMLASINTLILKFLFGWLSRADLEREYDLIVLAGIEALGSTRGLEKRLDRMIKSPLGTFRVI